jgi:hypothetical protein
VGEVVLVYFLNFIDLLPLFFLNEFTLILVNFLESLYLLLELIILFLTGMLL